GVARAGARLSRCRRRLRSGAARGLRPPLVAEGSGGPCVARPRPGARPGDRALEALPRGGRVVVRRPGAAAFARRAGGARGPRLVPPIGLAAAASVVVIVFGATPARAARVQPPEWTARLEAGGASGP